MKKVLLSIFALAVMAATVVPAQAQHHHKHCHIHHHHRICR
jgi:Ni/Co efflux regulator RcnB